MNKLVVLTFPNQSKIDEATATLRQLHSDGSIKFYASAVVTKGTDRKLSVREITRESHGGTAVAALIGALAGLVAGGPAAAAILATGGAVIGNAADMSSEDDFNEFANNIADSIAPGGAAIVADVTQEGVTAFTAKMQTLGATVVAR